LIARATGENCGGAIISERISLAASSISIESVRKAAIISEFRGKAGRFVHSVIGSTSLVSELLIDSWKDRSTEKCKTFGWQKKQFWWLTLG
jgi:hypothetical protein